jgi:hypothetical protein
MKLSKGTGISWNMRAETAGKCTKGGSSEGETNEDVAFDQAFWALNSPCTSPWCWWHFIGSRFGCLYWCWWHFIGSWFHCLHWLWGYFIIMIPFPLCVRLGHCRDFGQRNGRLIRKSRSVSRRLGSGRVTGRLNRLNRLGGTVSSLPAQGFISGAGLAGGIIEPIVV